MLKHYNLQMKKIRILILSASLEHNNKTTNWKYYSKRLLQIQCVHTAIEQFENRFFKTSWIITMFFQCIFSGYKVHLETHSDIKFLVKTNKGSELQIIGEMYLWKTSANLWVHLEIFFVNVITQFSHAPTDF